MPLLAHPMNASNPNHELPLAPTLTTGGPGARGVASAGGAEAAAHGHAVGVRGGVRVSAGLHAAAGAATAGHHHHTGGPRRDGEPYP